MFTRFVNPTLPIAVRSSSARACAAMAADGNSTAWPLLLNRHAMQDTRSSDCANKRQRYEPITLHSRISEMTV